MKAGQVLGALGILLVLGMMLQANAVAVQPPSTTIYVNTGGVIPFLLSLNTVGGKAYYATISLSAQTGLTATANVTAYPSGTTSTTNTTIPVRITVSGNPGTYQLNVTVTEYNSSTTPQSVLTTYKYTTVVHIISPQTLSPLLSASATTSEQKSVNVVIPAGASGWYLKYKVLYPNVTVASKYFSNMVLGATPSINITVTPSAVSGTTNATITFNVTVKSNLKFGEVPVTVVVNESLQGTNALYSTQVLHFNFFIVPTNIQNILVTSSRFNNFTTFGHVKFGNISIMSANMPASILSIVKGSNNLEILFNNTFTGMVSFQTNATPAAVYADGQKLVEGPYTIPANIPLGAWALIGNTVYVNADPSNVTVVYSNTTSSTSSTTTSTTTTSTTTSTATYTTQITNFYHEHRDLVLISVALLFVVIIIAVAVSKR
jgi:hypothetical protein